MQKASHLDSLFWVKLKINILRFLGR
jgi:hypothetical protein